MCIKHTVGTRYQLKNQVLAAALSTYKNWHRGLQTSTHKPNPVFACDLRVILVFFFFNTIKNIKRRTICDMKIICNSSFSVHNKSFIGTQSRLFVH